MPDRPAARAAERGAADVPMFTTTRRRCTRAARALDLVLLCRRVHLRRYGRCRSRAVPGPSTRCAPFKGSRRPERLNQVTVNSP